MISIAIEIQKLVRVANICLTVKDKDITPSLLTVEKDCLTFALTENNKNTTFRVCLSNLNHLELESTTLCNLSGRVFPKESLKELSFRVNIRSELLELEQSDCSTTSSTIYSHNVEDKFCFCACCGCKIGSVNCARLVDLPSSNWRELASEWFCHKHSHGESQSDEKDEIETLDFKNGDFVVGPTQIYFQKNCLSDTGDLKEVGDLGDEIKCHRCLTPLGYVTKSPLTQKSALYLCFMKHTIVFNSKDIPPVINSAACKKSLNDMVAKILLKVDSPIMATKFCFEVNNTEASKCLLIWLMDRNLPRFYAVRDLRDLGEGHEVEIKPRYVLKVLYNLVEPDSAKCQLWKNTFDCEIEQVCPRTLWDIVAILNESTETVPHSQRIIDDFVVGFFNQP